MFLNIIFFATLYPVLFIICIVFALQNSYKDGMLFAVNMKREWVEDENVKAIQKHFKKEMIWYSLILAIIPFSCLFIPYFSIQMTIWMVWLIVAIILLMLPTVFANNRLKQWKRKMGYYEEQSAERYVELKNAGTVHCMHFLPFFVPLALGTAAAIAVIPFAKVMGIFCLIGAASGYIFLLVAIWTDRQPVQVISSNSDININYTRAKKRIWKNMWLCAIWLNTALILFLILVSFMQKQVGFIYLAGMIIFIILLAAMCIPAIVILGRVEKAYEDKHDLNGGIEDDRNWIGGMLYYNPKDPHTIVDKRVGIGTTVNMASKAGKGTILFIIIALLMLPLVCVWVIAEEFTPIHLEIENQSLCAEQIRTDYEISLDDLDDVEILTELPNWSRVNGTGMETLEKGTFKISGEGECQVFLNSQNKKFLYFTANGKNYYMSGIDDTETEEIYQEIMNQK